MKYSKGDQVKMLTIFEGLICTVTGSVIEVTEHSPNLQCLLIAGKTSTGKAVRSHTYSDDKNLEKLQEVQQ